jgi:hypothetical protein
LPAHNLSKVRVNEANKSACMLMKAYSGALYLSQSQSMADGISHEELDEACQGKGTGLLQQQMFRQQHEKLMRKKNGHEQ